MKSECKETAGFRAFRFDDWLETAPMIGNRRSQIFQRVLLRVQVCEAGYGTPCWLWTGPTSGEAGRGNGYPRMCLGGQTVAVHRVVFTHFHGYVPGRKQIDHKCRNRLCVNPGHLEMVTHRQNQRRRDAARAAA